VSTYGSFSDAFLNTCNRKYDYFARGLSMQGFFFREFYCHSTGQKWQLGAVHLFHHYHERTKRTVVWGEGVKTQHTLFKMIKNDDLFLKLNQRFHAKMRGSSPQRVASHLPKIATHFFYLLM
jgi:hypothetical protein